MHVDPTVEAELGPKPLSKPPGQAFLPSIQGNGALSPTWGRDIAKKKRLVDSAPAVCPSLGKTPHKHQKLHLPQ